MPSWSRMRQPFFDTLVNSYFHNGSKYASIKLQRLVVFDQEHDFMISEFRLVLYGTSLALDGDLLVDTISDRVSENIVTSLEGIKDSLEKKCVLTQNLIN